MIYALLILVFLGVTGFFFWRDQSFVRKELRDVAPPELKKFLDLPHDEAKFSGRLPANPDNKRPSRRLLDEMNE